MACRQISFPSDDLVRRLTASLEHVAGMLAMATEVDGFVSALRANAVLWREIHQVSSELGWAISERGAKLSLSAIERAECGINDQEVDALICLNRAAARQIALLAGQPTGPPGSGNNPHWRDWMGRRFVVGGIATCGGGREIDWPLPVGASPLSMRAIGDER